MIRGEFSSVASSTPNSALAALIAAAVLVTTPASGSLGDLVVKSAKSIGAQTESLIVVDFGRNNVTLIEHSSGNASALATRCAAFSGTTKYTFVPAATDATSAQFQFKNSGGSSLNNSVGSVSGSGAFELAVKAAMDPTLKSFSTSALVNMLADALAGAQKEGLLVINTQDFTFTLFVMNDTSAITEFATLEAIDGIDNMTADSGISILHLEPAATSSVGSSII